ncbi:hypothetical protein Tco_0550592 [Tanacetum coccineum]
MSSQEQPSQVPITEPIIISFTTSHPTQTPSPMPHDSPLSGGHIPGSDEGSKKLNELTELCTKLSDKVTSLEVDIKQTKKLYGKALTKGCFQTGEDDRDRYEEVEIDLNQTDDDLQRRSIIEEIDLGKGFTLQQLTPTKVTQGEEQYLESFEAQLSVLSLFSTTEKVQGKEQISTDEKVAQKLNDKEMARAAAREEQERIDFKKALELQKQLDEREETDNID